MRKIVIWLIICVLLATSINAINFNHKEIGSKGESIGTWPVSSYSELGDDGYYSHNIYIQFDNKLGKTDKFLIGIVPNEWNVSSFSATQIIDQGNSTHSDLKYVSLDTVYTYDNNYDKNAFYSNYITVDDGNKLWINYNFKTTTKEGKYSAISWKCKEDTLEQCSPFDDDNKYYLELDPFINETTQQIKNKASLFLPTTDFFYYDFSNLNLGQLENNKTKFYSQQGTNINNLTIYRETDERGINTTYLNGSHIVPKNIYVVFNTTLKSEGSIFWQLDSAAANNGMGTIMHIGVPNVDDVSSGGYYMQDTNTPFAGAGLLYFYKHPGNNKIADFPVAGLPHTRNYEINYRAGYVNYSLSWDGYGTQVWNYINTTEAHPSIANNTYLILRDNEARLPFSRVAYVSRDKYNDEFNMLYINFSKQQVLKFPFMYADNQSIKNVTVTLNRTDNAFKYFKSTTSIIDYDDRFLQMQFGDVTEIGVYNAWLTVCDIGDECDTVLTDVDLNITGVNVSFIITAEDAGSGTPLTEFNATVSNATHSLFKQTVASELSFDDIIGLYDVLVQNDSYLDYNQNNWNVSNPLNAIMVSSDTSNILYDNCTAYSTLLMNLSIYNENTPIMRLPADIEIDASFWTDYTQQTNYSIQMQGQNNYTICTSATPAVLLTLGLFTNTYIKYTTEPGFSHRYFLINESMNETKFIDLYNFNLTSGISDLRVTLRNKNTYEYFKNIFGKFQRRYPGEGLWRTVQMDKTGDLGLNFFNIKEENTDYKFTFVDATGKLLRQTNSMKFSCDSGICDITLFLDPSGYDTATTNLQVQMYYDNVSDRVNVSWNDPLGGTTSVRFIVTKPAEYGGGLICNQTQVGAAGKMSCDVSAYDGNVLGRLYQTASPEIPFVTKWFNLISSTLQSFLDVEDSALWTVGIVTMITFTGIFSPVATIIATVIGLIMSMFLGIFNAISMTIIVIVGVLAIIVGLKLRN